MRCVTTGRVRRAVGLGVLFSALGCGGKAGDDSPAPAPSYSAPRATPTSPPVASPPYRPQPAPSQPAPPPPPNPVPVPTPGPADLARAAAENVLLANCGPCHGSNLTPAQAQYGINYIDDIDKLVETGLIVPLSSATSRIIVLMRNGTQPPSYSGYPVVTDADIEVVASYIDNPRFWPILVPAQIVDAGTGHPIVDAGADGG